MTGTRQHPCAAVGTEAGSDRCAASAAQMADLRPVLSSARLFDGRREILIDHRGEHYRLCITRQGRLILMK